MGGTLSNPTNSDTPPTSVNLMALVVDNLDDSVLVAPQARRNVRIAVDVERQALCFCLRLVFVVAFLQNGEYFVFHGFDA